MKFVQCDCGHVWYYLGASEYRTTCPRCHKTVYLQSHLISAEKFLELAKAQLAQEYHDQVSMIEKVVRECRPVDPIIVGS